MTTHNEIQDAQIVATSLTETIADLISHLGDGIDKMITLQTGSSPKIVATPAGLKLQLDGLAEKLNQIFVLNDLVGRELAAIKGVNEAALAADMDIKAPVAA
jgi:hypothetical protein